MCKSAHRQADEQNMAPLAKGRLHEGAAGVAQVPRISFFYYRDENVLAE